MRPKPSSYLCFFALIIILLFSLPALSSGRESPLPIEKRLTEAMKQTFRTKEDVYVRVDNVPLNLNEEAKIKSIDLVKVPEPGGKGLALVRYRGIDSRIQSSFIAFRTFENRRLFYLKRNMKRGERIEHGDLETKSAYVGENSFLYPESLTDLGGKVLRKDMSAGSLLTFSVIEEPQAIKRGQDVTIVCQNSRLTIQTTGKASETGKRGDRIRVKNFSSDREVFGRIVDNNTVMVEF